MAALRLATPSNKPMYRWSAVYDLEIIIRLRQGCSFKVQTWHEWFELQDFDYVTRLKKKKNTSMFAVEFMTESLLGCHRG